MQRNLRRLWMRKICERMSAPKLSVETPWAGEFNDLLMLPEAAWEAMEAARQKKS